MTTLTIPLSEAEKQLLEQKAASEGKSVADFLLEATEVRKQGSIYQAVAEIEQGEFEVISLDSFRVELESIQAGCTK